MNSKKKPVVKSVSTKTKKRTAQLASPQPVLPLDDAQRKLAEGALQDARDNIEKVIGTTKTNKEKRAAELAKANKELVFKINERKRAEEAIRSLARFPSENPNPILRIARDGNLLYGNPAAFTLLKKWKLRVGKPAPEVLKNMTREALETETTKTVDIPCGDRIFSITIAPAPKDKDVNLYARDVTERMRTEEALLKSERKFRETITYLDEGYYHCTMEGVLLDHNRAFNRMLGFEISQDLKGRKLPDFWRNPEDRKTYVSELMTRGVVRNYLIKAKTVGGEKVVVMANSHLVKDEKGKPVGIEGTFTNMTDSKRMEDALKESEAKYRALFENAQIGIYRTKMDGSAILDVNQNLLDNFGYTREEMIASPSTMRWAHREEREEMARRLRADGVVTNLEVAFITKTGESRDYLISAKLYPEQGVLEGTGLDITGRKQAEEELRESENTVLAWLNAIQESAFLMDREGIILAVNATTAQRLHRSVEELVGACIYDFIPPQTAQSRRLHIAQVIESGQPVQFEDERFGRVINNLIYPVFDQSGHVKHMAILGTDVTERKQAEEQIRQLNAELEATVEKRTAQLSETLDLNQKMIEASSLGIFACRADGPCIIANPAIARISGAPVEKMLQLNFRELESWKKNGLFDKAEAALSTGKEQRAEIHLTTTFGRDAWLNYYFTTFTSNGELHFLMIVDDISERKQAEQALQQRTVQLEAANQELEAFSYSISHDLRSPLRAMDGFSRILLEDYAPQLPAEAQRYLNLVRDNAKQMGHLIEDLLAFSRLSRLPLHKQTVAMAEVVQKALAELDPEQQGRNVEVTIGDLPACEADPALLKQVWVNLLSNAFKFTRKREVASIEVGSLDISDRSLQIAEMAEPLKSEILNLKSAIYFIRDNGVGFDMQYVDKLFGVFQRLHRSEDYEGTGVGLAIVQRIVHRHGGGAWAEAEVDKGATFYFTI